jgi:hypothetical protein
MQQWTGVLHRPAGAGRAHARGSASTAGHVPRQLPDALTDASRRAARGALVPDRLRAGLTPHHRRLVYYAFWAFGRARPGLRRTAGGLVKGCCSRARTAGCWSRDGKTHTPQRKIFPWITYLVCRDFILDSNPPG